MTVQAHGILPRRERFKKTQEQWEEDQDYRKRQKSKEKRKWYKKAKKTRKTGQQT